MTTATILEQLRQIGVELHVAGGRLRVNAPKGALTEALRTVLTERKAEILSLLGTQQNIAGASDLVGPRLSFTQERLWFVDNLDRGNAAYNIPLALRFHAALNLKALAATMGELLRRHDALRTVCALTPEGPRQLLLSVTALPLPIEDLLSLESPIAEAEARRIAVEEFRRPFNLTTGPLLRQMLIRLPESQSILVLTLHHFVADGWSIQVLLHELAALYQAFSEGHKSPLPEMAVQFRDFSEWQRKLLQGPAMDRQMDYWKQRLTPLPPTLDLPTDRSRPAMQKFQGGACPLDLRNQAEGLRALMRSERATLFMALLAIFRALLFRYTQETDAAIGTAVSNRNRAQFEGVIGPMSNNLVLRADCPCGQTYRELLRQVRHVAIEALEHQELPFEWVVKAVQPERDTSRNPLFQVLFMVHTAHSRKGTSNFPFALEDFNAGIVSFDLVLAVVDGAELQGHLHYNSSLYDSATAARMAEHFRNLLDAAILRPDEPLAALPLLTDSERHQLLREWTATKAEFPHQSLIHDLVQAQIEKMPDAVAVVFGDQTLSYRDLDERSNQLAWHLRSRGVGPETLVGILVQRSLEMLIGVFAIVKAGAAYLPLDPAYPQERLRFMLDDADARHLLTQENLLRCLPEHDAEKILLDADWPMISSQDKRALPPLASPDNLACVIYTSGTTGNPKGTMLLHRGLVNQLCWRQATYRLGPEDVVLNAASFCFDICQWDFFGPLMAGARLVMSPTEAPPDSAQLVHLLSRYRISVLQCPSSRMQAVMREPDADTCDTLRCLIVGGDVLSLELQERLLAGFTRNLYNLYGPSEASIDVTAWECNSQLEHRSVPIGRPIFNQRVYLLDAAMEPVPVGITGEIYIGGAGLARGYLHRPWLTAERFVPDPFADEAGERLYRTGDKARWLAHGNLEFLGRADQQVKVRGLRIELAEITAVLESCRGVNEAVVIVREDQPGDQLIIAYLVADGVLDLTELRSAVRRRLPLFMVPAAFIRLESIPLTPNGKIDRNALPLPGSQRRGKPYAGPRDPVEELIALIWAEVLGSPQVSIHDDFFESGGHSLLAGKVISRVAASLGVEVPLRIMFERPTVAGMAEHVRDVRNSLATLTPFPLYKIDRSGKLPLSFGQQRLWFLEQLGPAAPSNRIPCVLRLQGTLNLSALQHSLDEIVRRHEVLRTNFDSIDGEVVQVIAAPASIALPVMDIEHLSADQQKTEIKRLVATGLKSPMDLARDPLLKISVLRLGTQEHILCLIVHHIIIDEWSVGILKAELASLYRSFFRDEPSSLAQIAVQYADFAAWQRGWLTDQVLDNQIQYWRQQLAGVEALHLPTDRVRQQRQTFRGQRRMIRIPAGTAEALAQLGRQEGVTPFMMLMTAFMVFLGRYSGQNDISVGTPAAHRPHTDLENLIGLFLNTLVLRGKLSGSETFCGFLRQIRETCLDAFAHQELPFEKLVSEMHVERSLNRSPLFQVMFVLHSPQEDGLEFDEMKVTPEPVEIDTVTFDLILSLSTGNGMFEGSLEYNADLFDMVTTERMARHFEMLVAGIASHAHNPMRDLPMFTGAEHHQLLAEWNTSTFSFSGQMSVHALFEAQVKCSAESVAVIQGKDRINYDELNRRANRVAYRLLELGAGPEISVGLCMERSIAMVVGMLAILKAGATIISLDAAQPAARLGFMARDAGIKLVLTRDDQPLSWLEDPAQIVPLQAAESSQENEQNPCVPVAAENLAYIIYTSGSTGSPKGVAVPHGSLSNTLLWRKAAFALSGRERVLQNIPATFDPSLWQIFGSLISGAALVLLRHGGHQDFPHILEEIAAHKITITDFSPSLLQELLEIEDLQACDSLRRIFVGGEVLSAALQEKFFQRLPSELHNVYGPSEVAIDATCWTCQHGAAAKSVPIGRPISNKAIYILDVELRPVPIGVTGEIYIGGAGLARGYVGQPGLTAEQFLPNPFSAPGSRFYRTGDMGRYRFDGAIEFLGRRDYQVKIRGVRVELEEIERVLERHLDIKEAVVTASPWHGENRLVAYITPVNPSIGAPEAAALRAYLKESLPDSMVPSAYVSLEILPRSSSGKVDRQALPQPDDAAAASPQESIAQPRNAMERGIAKIWQEVLGVSVVGINDNFFDLGGHSLLLARVHRRLCQDLGRNLQLVDLFRCPSIRSLAKHLSGQEEDQVPAERLRNKALRQIASISRQQEAYRSARRPQ
jgi:amino acid adenylation domain-containing protein